MVTRREAGKVIGGTAAALVLPIIDQAKGESSTMLARSIPSSGEKLPVIGLGTWKAFDVDLSMSAIFETPTVFGLAGAVRASRLGSEELAEVDQILDDIEGLSPEELEALLAEEMELEGDEAHGG